MFMIFFLARRDAGCIIYPKLTLAGIFGLYSRNFPFFETITKTRTM